MSREVQLMSGFDRCFRDMNSRRGVLCVVSLATVLALGILTVVIGPEAERAAAGDTLLFVGDFETGDLSGFYWNYNKPQVVSSPHPVRDGEYSLRNYLDRYESDYPHRCDLHINGDDSLPEGTRQVMRLDIGAEYWFGFSIYIPPDFVPDLPGRSEVLFQIHGDPDKDDQDNYLEEWRNPPFAVRLEEDNWKFTWLADSKEITPPSGTPNRYTYSKELLHSLGGDVGKWTDFVVNIRLDYSSGGAGFTKIWKDGQLIIDLRGPNCFNDRKAPYPVIGLYKWSWKDDYESNMDSRLFYIDELRIGDAAASYCDVVPGGCGEPASPTVTLTSMPTRTPIPTASPTSASEPETNLVLNPGFEEGTSGWSFYTDGSATFEAAGAAYEGSSAAEVSISGTGSNVQLYQHEVSLRPNVDYRLEFAAKCNTGHDIEVRIHKHDSPYSDYWGLGYQTYDLTSEWRVFTTDFTSASDAATDARLRFWLSPYESAGDVYWIDSVRLVEANGTKPTATESPTSTATSSPTSTPTPSPSSTPTASPTSTSTATATSTSTASPTSAPPASLTSIPTIVSIATATPTPNPDEVVIDNTDGGFSTSFSQDSWAEYAQEGGRHYRGSHYYNREIGTGQDTATWSFAVPKPGRYEVYAWWWEGNWRPTDVPYTINDLGGSTTIRVNQQVEGGQWNLLGIFDFLDQGSVVVSDDASSGQEVVADAIRLVYLEPSPSTTATSTAVATPISTPAVVPTVTVTPTPNPDEIVIDNTDGGFSTSFSQDIWEEYSQGGGRHYGDSHYYNRQIGTGRDIAVWSFTVPKPGRYEVYAWWWEGSWRPTDVPYTVNHLDGSTTIRVNQQVEGGHWNFLGAFDFLDRGSVVVSDDASSGQDVVADAISLVYVEASASATVSSTPTATPISTAAVVPTATATPASNPDEVIIDDTDGGFSTSFSQDIWQEYTQGGGRHYGDSHYYNRQIGTGRDIAVWSFTVPKPGSYKVYAWWWEGKWRPKDVPYTINHLDGSTTVRVNQRVRGGRWNLLGTFDFLDRGSIAVSDDASSGHDVVADAVRVVYERPLRRDGSY